MHDNSGRIVVQGLTKSFGPIHAVHDLSFAVEPGVVTGFLGPNGSGKTTTLRMILGLISPTEGTATVNGLAFHRLPRPASVVGAVLDAQSFHPGRTAIGHLRCYAAAMGVPDEQAQRALHLVGLSNAARRRAGGFSLGMRQRLALATALLGDPQILVLDEPANGLDPEGIAWLRNFLRSFAASGRTVLASSHLLREMEHTVDHVVIISRGQCVYDGHLEQLRAAQRTRALVRASDPTALVSALAEHDLGHEQLPDGRIAVTGADSRAVGEIALRAGVALHEANTEQLDLEQLFFQLTSGQYAGNQPPGPYAPDPYAQGPYGPPPQGGQPPQAGPGAWGPPGPPSSGQPPHGPGIGGNA